MRKRGFSATTAVLVAVLLGALFVVSKSVTPPPPGPPEPPKSAQAQANMAKPAKSSEEQKKEMQEQHEQMMKMMHARGKVNAKGQPISAPKPHFDPNTIEVTPAYFGQAKMGSNGESEMQVKVAKAKAEIAIEQEKKKAQQAISGAAPPNSTPGSSASPIPSAVK